MEIGIFHGCRTHQPAHTNTHTRIQSYNIGEVEFTRGFWAIELPTTPAPFPLTALPGLGPENSSWTNETLFMPLGCGSGIKKPSQPKSVLSMLTAMLVAPQCPNSSMDAGINAGHWFTIPFVHWAWVVNSDGKRGGSGRMDHHAAATTSCCCQQPNFQGFSGVWLEKKSYWKTMARRPLPLDPANWEVIKRILSAFENPSKKRRESTFHWLFQIMMLIADSFSLGTRNYSIF